VGFNLAGSFVGSHLQADGGLVEGFVRLGLWIIQMSPGAVRSHPRLTRTLVCPHLRTKEDRKSNYTSAQVVEVNYEVFCSKYQTDHPFYPCLISLYFTSCFKSADFMYKAL